MNCKSVWLSSRSHYDTSMYEAGGSRQPKLQQYYVDGSCVLDLEKVFDTKWQSHLLYILPELEFLTSLITLILLFSLTEV
jgi:hypothetical protein